jgi:xanthine dehydrogenase YagR molybdenum-binding subunit
MAKRKTRAGFAGNEKEIEVDVPDDEPAIWGADAKLRTVGTAVPRVDGLVKAAGRAEYTADVNLPGMLHGRMLRAAAPGGKVVSLDVSAVEKAPGVKYVRVVAPPGAPLTHDGRDLAFVVADTPENVEAALLLAKVGIEPGPVVTTEEDAMADGAPSVVPDRADNVRGVRRGSGGKGDPAVAFKEAEEAMKDADAVIERTYRTQVQVHTPLEPHGVVVKPAEDGSLVVWASTQGTFGVAGGIAGALGLPRGKVEAIAEHVGGGFGCKFGPSAPGSGFGVEAARAAVALGVPVRAMLSRREEHLVGGNRPSSIQDVKLGVKKDGTIVGYTVRFRGTAGFLEQGAGASNPMHFYALGKKAKEDLTVLTHAGPAAAFRAPGHPQGSFGQESALDEAAAAIGMDPLELRLRLDVSPVRQAQYRMGAERFGWREKRRVRPGAGPGPVKRGVGMGSAVWHLAGGPGHSVDVTVHRDGTVEVSNGAQDIGTGTRTVLAVIVAEVLGLEPASIQVNLGRTRWPSGPGSGGSTTAPSLGPCARAAAEKAREAILGSASPGSAAAWKAACARMDGEKATWSGARPRNYEAFQGGVAGVQFVEVEVDCETGVVRVVRVLAIQDCGRVIDRLTAESQVLGGVIQGISYALFEDRVLDRKTGRLLHGDLEGYRIAGSKDVPDIEVEMFEVANAGNSVGMAGLGEPPTVPTAGAIANAVAHATGARVRELPISPARVLAALAAKEK